MKRRFLKVLSLLVAINFLLQVFYPSIALALTGGPRQPELEPFSQQGTTDMVDLYSGDFVYTIPLLTVPGLNGGYPINLSYHAGIGVEQEASWVGLGWSLNPGTISREVRGIPDDICGQTITRNINTRDNVTVGFGAGIGFPEIFGGDLGLSLGYGLFYNNYKGFGLSFEAGLSPMQNEANKPSKGTTEQCDSDKVASFLPSAHFSINSQEGTNFGISLSALAKRNLNSVSGGYSVNSRSGDNYNLSASTGHYPFSFTTNNSVPFIETSTTGHSMDFILKLGLEMGGVFPSVDLKGRYCKSGLSTKTIEEHAYGYLYSQNADNGLMDISRENDVALTGDIPYLPLPVATYDMYNVQTEGVGGSFRAYRSDVGTYSDPQKINTITSADLSLDIGLGTQAKFGGFGYSKSFSDSYYGGWSNSEDFLNDVRFNSTTSEQPLFEPFYFKFLDEITTNERSEDSRFLDDNAIRPDLQMNIFDFRRAKAYNSIGGNYHSKRNFRAIRNQMIEYKTIDEIININNLLYSSGNGPKNLYDTLSNKFENYNYNQYSAYGVKGSQIAEFSILNTTGSRYVYGIPVYNLDQVSVCFSVEPSGSAYSYNKSTSYSATDASVENKKGRDHFYSRTTTPAYAHSCTKSRPGNLDGIAFLCNYRTKDNISPKPFVL